MYQNQMYPIGTFIVEERSVVPLDNISSGFLCLQNICNFVTYCSTLFNDRITFLLIVLFCCFLILQADDGVGLMAVEESKMGDTHPKDAETRNSSPWEPTATSRVLYVPLAEMWREGMTIADDRGNITYKVLHNELLGRTKAGDPILQATIGNERDEVIAVIRREMDLRHLTDGFTIYSMTPNWTGQSATVIRHLEKESGFEMFALARFEQSPLGKDYTLKASQDGKIMLSAENQSIRLTFLCCPCFILCGCFKAWQLEFFKVGQGSCSVVVRDQQPMTLTVSPGESLLLAVCIAYAVDRVTIMACC
jgi:hypothetical protein